MVPLIAKATITASATKTGINTCHSFFFFSISSHPNCQWAFLTVSAFCCDYTILLTFRQEKAALRKTESGLSFLLKQRLLGSSLCGNFLAVLLLFFDLGDNANQPALEPGGKQDQRDHQNDIERKAVPRRIRLKGGLFVLIEAIDVCNQVGQEERKQIAPGYHTANNRTVLNGAVDHILAYLLDTLFGGGVKNHIGIKDTLQENGQRSGHTVKN